MSVIVSIIRASTPFGYVQYYRYYRGLRLVSYILGDLAPIAIYVYLATSSVNWVAFGLAWLLFWSFYEVGYLHNDVYSVKNERQATLRIPNILARFFWLIVFIRVVWFTILAIALYYQSEMSISTSISVVGITAAVFLIHNTLSDYKNRMITLALLGLLKPMFIPLILNVTVEGVVVLFLPSLLVKVFDYASKKGLAKYPLRDDRTRRLCLMLAYVPVLLLIDAKLVLAYSSMLFQTIAMYFFRLKGDGNRILKD